MFLSESMTPNQIGNQILSEMEDKQLTSEDRINKAIESFDELTLAMTELRVMGLMTAQVYCSVNGLVLLAFSSVLSKDEFREFWQGFERLALGEGTN
jgi:predicted Zn-dependent protease